MLDLIKSLDAFPKAHDDYRIKTYSGALVSIISVTVMVLLFLSELRYYMKPEKVEHLYVNTTRSNSISIDFDISFPTLSCNLLSMDAIDDRGIPQVDAVHDLFKHKLDFSGQKVGSPQRQELGNTIQSEAELEKLTKLATDRAKVIKEKIGDCGNCYGAGRPGQCCQTCDDVKRLYEHVGWKFKPQGILQCMSESYLTTLKEQFAEDGGCQVYGELSLSKSSGHFHIAPHKKLHAAQPGGNNPDLNNNIFNLMDLISFAFDQFNVTHTINSLSFGSQYPGISSPLDAITRKVVDTHGMYQYYIKVVPTLYKGKATGQPGVTEIESNQYSVTEHMSHLAPGSGRGLPGVYFYYEISPISAVIEEKEKKGTFWRFLTSVCAIIGGAYSLMGLVDLLVAFVLGTVYKESL